MFQNLQFVKKIDKGEADNGLLLKTVMKKSISARIGEFPPFVRGVRGFEPRAKQKLERRLVL